MCSCVGCLCESVWMDWFGECSKTSSIRPTTVNYIVERITKALLFHTIHHRDEFNDLVSVCVLFYVCIELSNHPIHFALTKWTTKWFIYFLLHPKIIFQIQNPSLNDQSEISIFINISSEIFKFNFVWRWIQKKKKKKIPNE